MSSRAALTYSTRSENLARHSSLHLNTANAFYTQNYNLNHDMVESKCQIYHKDQIKETNEVNLNTYLEKLAGKPGKPEAEASPSLLLGFPGDSP